MGKRYVGQCMGVPIEVEDPAYDIPRRADRDRMTKAELAILDAVWAVELAGAHPLLTDAVMLLQQAREKVADFVDGKR